MRYEIPILWRTASAKSKALIPEHVNIHRVEHSLQQTIDWVIVEAVTDDQAYAVVARRLSSTDNRPIHGRSYVRKWRAPHVRLNDGLAPTDKLPRFKKDDRIILHGSHANHRVGSVDEVLSAWNGVRLDDYPHIADFHIREFALYDERA